VKLEDLKALCDSELALFMGAAETELKDRAETRKQATIAKIKELASAEGLSVSIAGQRGRPPKNGHKRETTTQQEKVAVGGR
jgi:hypothetical protein